MHTRLLIALSLLTLGCEITVNTGKSPDTDTPDDTDTGTAGDDDDDGIEAFNWADPGFDVGDTVQHVTEIVISPDGGTVWAAWYTPTEDASVARSTDGGASWTNSDLGTFGMRQIRALVRLSSGRLVAGGSFSGPNTPLRYSDDDGASWQACASGMGPGAVPLPTTEAQTVWDLAVAPDGMLYIATDALSNDPGVSHRTVLRSDDGCTTVVPVSPLLGMGVTAVAVDDSGRVYVATSETDEHDDPSVAGNAYIYRSDDQGDNWSQTADLGDANRVYRILVKSDGSLLAGTGLYGDVYRSQDGGDSWKLRTHVPQGSKEWGDPPETSWFDATRVYGLLELQDGRVLAGTGNSTGDVFITSNDGRKWSSTGDTGDNIVCWALAQAPDGTVWIGTGSRGGSVLKGTPP